MIRCYLTAYPWDLLHEGVDTVLDHLQGEVGATGLSLWMGTPPLMQLNARQVQPRVFRTAGGLYFTPEEAKYLGTRLKPIVSSDLPHRDLLSQVADACRRKGIELRAIVPACNTGLLAQHYPETACENVLGDRSHTSVCLSNPDVQEYLAGLVSDLCDNCDLSGIVLTGFVVAWTEAQQAELTGAEALSPDARLLLGTCFCDSCRQRATESGGDPETAKQAARTIVQAALDAGELTGDMLVAPADGKPLFDYFRSRGQTLSTLIERLSAECSCDLILGRTLDEFRQSQHAGLDYSTPAAVRTWVDNMAQAADGVCESARANELHLSSKALTDRRSEELVSLLHNAAQQGYCAIEVGDYGLLTTGAFDSIRQAFRYAKRSARS